MKPLRTIIHHSNSNIAKIIESLLDPYGVQTNVVFNEGHLVKSINDSAHSLYVIDYSCFLNGKQYIQGILKEYPQHSYLLLPNKRQLLQAIEKHSQSDKLMITAYDSGLENIVEKLQMSTALKTNFTLEEEKIFYPIGINQIKSLLPTNYDLYMRFSEHKYTRVYDANNPSSTEVIQKYIDQGLNNFYLKENDYYSFSNLIIKNIEQGKKEFIKSATGLKSLNFQSSQRIYEMLDNLNISKKAIAQANEVLQGSTKEIQKSSQIFNKIKELNLNNNFVSDHNIMLVYILSALVCELELNDSYACQKLCMASLLHDIAIDEAHIQESYNKSIRREDQRQEVITHPFRAVELTKKLNNLSPDIEKIILQHHETQDGTGYPRGIDHRNITLLSAIFIVAEDFVTHIYGQIVDQDYLNTLIDQMGQKYTKTNFRMVYTAFCKLISKSQNILFSR